MFQRLLGEEGVSGLTVYGTAAKKSRPHPVLFPAAGGWGGGGGGGLSKFFSTSVVMHLGVENWRRASESASDMPSCEGYVTDRLT
jgi:hypothetical protein